MKLNKFFVTLPLLLSLTACSCGNKLDGNKDGMDGMNSVDGMDVSEANSIFKGKISDRVFFSTNKNHLSEESKTILREQAEFIKQNNVNSNLVVEGHCDERGPVDFNLALGERRANAASKFLVHSGIHHDKISTVSYGKERPQVEGHTPEAWAQNRTAITKAAE